MSTDGGCFIGASLSCADIVTYLYSKVLRITPERLTDPDRDYFLLSKGHDVPAVYGTLAELGYFPKERLKNHLSPTDSMYWHPNRKIPGVEFHSGSLGHLLSVSIGIAMDIKMRGAPNRVFVVLGDGECDEGSIWEGLLVAKAYGLDNLVAIVDRNEFQANIRTEELIPLEPFKEKFMAFGWEVRDCDGHDFDSLAKAFEGLPATGQSAEGGWDKAGRPTMVIARTVRGKGLPSIERRADRWFVNFKAEEIEALLKELHGVAAAELTSETLMVR
ncbi:MAG: transketolase [Polyangiaceae bacterium]|nr:transketolase [Polyangiaceae bacterium]